MKVSKKLPQSLAFLCLLGLTPAQVYSQVTSAPNAEEETGGVTASVDGEGMLRARVQESKDTASLEAGLAIIGKINVDGLFEIIGVIRTGSNYGSSTNTIYNHAAVEGERFDPSTALAVRNLYIQKSLKEHLIQLGAIPVDNGIATTKTAMSTIGWIDGGRVKVNTDYGSIMVTAGYLSEYEQTDVADRIPDWEANYFELVVSTKVFEKLALQAGAERFEDENFVKAAVKYDLTLATEQIITAIAEGIVNTDTGALTASAGLSTDIVGLITGGERKGVVLSASYIYRTEDATGRLADYRNGIDGCVGTHCGLIALNAPITKDKRVSVYTQVRIEEVAENNRYEAGIKVAFGKKKKK